MNIVALSGSKVGSKTKTAMVKTIELFGQKYSDHEVKLLDLADYNVEFSDGRNYFEYEGAYRTDLCVYRGKGLYA